jgi:hypothetical protein
MVEDVVGFCAELQAARFGESKVLEQAISKLVRLGLFSEFRPTVPKLIPCRAAKAPGLNNSGPYTPGGLVVSIGIALGLPIWSRYDPIPVPLPTPALNRPSATLNGVPV